jgi:Fe-S oxidoreductase
MLKLARSAGRRVLEVLDGYLSLDIPVVVPEPSCLATFRDELPKLLPNDPRARKLASLSRSLAEHLEAISWTAPRNEVGGTISVHPHCHQRAVQGMVSELRVLGNAGFEVNSLDLGCCGLAGSFGFERDHDEFSRRIAQDRFAPGIIRSSLDGPVILDGFSCQLQASGLTNVKTTSTAEVLAGLLRIEQSDGYKPESDAIS